MPMVSLLAHTRAGTLDRRLMAGADPTHSALLAARAAALTSQRSRESVAGSLEGLLTSVLAGPTRLRLRPHRHTVLASEPLIHSLAERLRGPAPVYAPGVARLHVLLTDGTGPVFQRDADRLAAELDAAAAELGGDERRGRALGAGAS